MAIDITQDNVEKEVMKESKPVILDVYATWCGPCQQMAPIFDELEKEMGETHKFAKLNVDEARDLSIKFGVISVPTFLFMKDGNIVGKETGYMAKDQLKEKIEAAFS